MKEILNNHNLKLKEMKMERKFVFQKGTFQKFWTITVVGTEYTANSSKPVMAGTQFNEYSKKDDWPGDMESDSFDTIEECQKKVEKLIANRLKQGYKEFQNEIDTPEPVNTEEKSNMLIFDNYNFKLAVISELMFVKEILKPKFDVYEFAKNTLKQKIDMDDLKQELEMDNADDVDIYDIIEYIGYSPIEEVELFFWDLEIDKKLAAEIDKLSENYDCYLQIWPRFSPGNMYRADEYFTVKELTKRELEQFPNLKAITSYQFDVDESILEEYEIEHK